MGMREQKWADDFINATEFHNHTTDVAVCVEEFLSAKKAPTIVSWSGVLTEVRQAIGLQMKAAAEAVLPLPYVRDAVKASLLDAGAMGFTSVSALLAEAHATVEKDYPGVLNVVGVANVAISLHAALLADWDDAVDTPLPHPDFFALAKIGFIRNPASVRRAA